jgi:tripartite-type tricarboxylate transporter receptor subunit TctC
MRVGSVRWPPRPVIAIAAAAVSLWLAALTVALAADVKSLQGLPITFVEPYGPHSVTHIPLALMQGEIGRKTGATVEIRSIGGKAGGSALDYVINSPPGGLVFAVLDPLSRQLAEVGGERADLLGAVQPVAKLSAGISAALIVAEASPIRNIDDFLAQAHSRQLRLVHLGRTAAFGLEVAMLEKKFGLSFVDKVVGTRAQILEALASGEADAGFLTTITLLPSADTAPPPVRPLLTFGAKRNPKLPAVPTFRERSGDPKGSITSAIEVFAERTLRKEAAATIEAVMAEIAAEPAIRKAAAADNFPLEVGPPSAVAAEIARGARLIAAHREYLLR